MTAKPRLACIGECMIEFRTRPDGLLARSFGGDTLNTAIYLARLGVAVDYVTALGDDDMSTEMLAAWAREGVGTALIPRLAGRLPGLYLIETDASGERRFLYWRDSAPVRQLFDLPQTAAIETALEQFDMLYLSGVTLSLFQGAARARLLRLLEATRARGGKIVFDTNFRPRGWPDPQEAREVFAHMLALSHIVLAGVEDYALLEHDGSREGILARLRRGCVPEAVIKLAEPACLVLGDGQERLVPITEPVTPLDTTAAGDSFAAAYLAARLSGKTPEAAAQDGHRLAGVVIGHPGAIIPRSAMPPAS